MIEILATGPLTTVQDAGRPGYAALGVPRSGAFDRAAAGLANRLVGNRPDAALLEVTLGGLQLRTRRAHTFALTGAACPGRLGTGRAVSVPAGTEIALGPPVTGLRSYLAVRGGIAVAPVLGSCSTDLLSALGPPPVRVGDVLATGTAVASGRGGAVSDATASARLVPAVLLVDPAPRADWFAASALPALTATKWTVRGESDRIGIRLDGPLLERARREELPSEPMLPGAVQVPPDGRPIVFGPDCPVTGGYPVIAVVRPAGLDAAAQLRPGDVIRFATGR